jgi:hypothetical protein
MSMSKSQSVTPPARSGFFVKTPHELLRRCSHVSAQARFLWIVLMSYADSDGTRCFPGVARLASDMGRDRKAVFRYLDELEKAGLIRRTSGRKANEFATNSYRILPPSSAPAAALAPAKPTAEPHAKITSTCPQNGTPTCPQNGDTTYNQLPKRTGHAGARKTRKLPWDGLGGQEKDGRRNLWPHPPRSAA